MNSLYYLLYATLLMSVVHGQGFLLFRTVDPIFDIDGKTLLTGDAFLAQLYAGLTETNLAAIGAPLPFRTAAKAGYISTNIETVVPGLDPGWPAEVQVRAWQASDGQSYEAAVAARGHFGASKIARVFTGGFSGGVPFVPDPLVGLGSFALSAGPVPARLALESPAAQTLSLSILAQPATQWDVYSSPDLTAWHTVQTFTIDATGEAKLQLPLAGSERMFYRAVLAP